MNGLNGCWSVLGKHHSYRLAEEANQRADRGKHLPQGDIIGEVAAVMSWRQHSCRQADPCLTSHHSWWMQQRMKLWKSQKMHFIRQQMWHACLISGIRTKTTFVFLIRSYWFLCIDGHLGVHQKYLEFLVPGRNRKVPSALCCLCFQWSLNNCRD